jgi:hypothetical protein
MSTTADQLGNDKTRGPLILLISLGAAAVTLPALGFIASLAIRFVAQRQRRLLWPRASTATSWFFSFLAFAGLWWTIVASTIASSFGPLPLPLEGDTLWLLLPLCGPDNRPPG